MISKSRWGQLICLVLLTSAAALPLQPLLTGHVPWQGDGLLHIYRLGALAEAVDWTWLYPRWVPDLGYGYGFPLFNYYAPLSYYVVLPAHLLGISMGTATRLSYGLALMLLGGSVWGWGRENGWGSWGLLVVSAPYLAYNLYHRAALAEIWGIAMLALTFWLVQRLVDKPTAGRLFGATLAYASLLFTHNITALIGTALLIGLVVWLQLPPQPSKSGWPAWLWVPLGLTISAFFWVPAIFESDLVQIGRLTDAANFSYVNHFLSFSDWLSWPRPADPALINPPLPLAVGTGQLFLAAVALLLLIVERRSRPPSTKSTGRDRRLVIGLLLALALTLFMTTESSSLLYSLLSPLSFVQFPWRFLGPAAILLGMLNAYALHTLWHTQKGWLQAAAVLLPLVMIAQQLPYLFPPPNPPLPPRAARAELNNFELSSGWLGTTSAGDYLPVAVTDMRFWAAERPEFQGRTLIVEAVPENGVMVLPQLAFPGWTTAVDGEPVPWTSEERTGLLRVSLPPEAQMVTLTYRGTALQRTMSWLSGLSALLLLGVMAWRRPAWSFPKWSFERPTVITILLVFPLVLLLKTAGYRQVDNPFRQSRFDGIVVSGVPPQNVNFANKLRLIGAEAPAEPLPADQPLAVDLYWQGISFSEELSVGLHLLDQNGRRVAQSDSFHPADFPLPRWRPEQYARDTHQLILPPGTPPGTYPLQLFVYTANGQIRQEILNEGGLPVGVETSLFQIEIAPPNQPATAVDIRQTLNYPLTNNISILGADFESSPAKLPGESLFLRVYWQVNQPPSENERPDQPITLVSRLDQSIVAEFPLSSHIPNGSWRPNEIRYDDYLLRVPPDVPTDVYDVVLNGQRLASTDIYAPERLTVQPSIDQTLDQNLGDIARLVGATVDECEIDQDRCRLTVQLVWQARQETHVSYKVFLQFLGADGRPVAQADQIPTHQQVDLPTALTRPTTSWLAGEYLIDNHTFTIPVEQFESGLTLIAGLYDPQTGERLPTAEGGFVTIPVR